MSEQLYNVLFICTGNSARSIMAEALLNQAGRGRFRAYSAGSRPKGSVHPLTLRALQELRMPTDGLRSKSWNEFAGPDAPVMDFVFTVCDSAAGEACPIWPGQPLTAAWGMPDPAAVDGPDDVRMKHFLDAALTLKRRIDLMLSLPLDGLDDMSARRHLDEIGKA